MSNHITINGQTYASVEEMPPEIRRQYESAIQMLGRNALRAAGSSDTDVTITSDNGDPALASFKTVTRIKTRRINLNGKDYHRLEDIPADVRAAMGDAAFAEAFGLHDGAEQPNAGNVDLANINRMSGGRSLRGLTSDSMTSVTMSRSTLIVLLVVVLLVGMFIGTIAAKFLH